jgi:ADP-L-glycero-D-manno-heptose 6-epimerase
MKILITGYLGFIGSHAYKHFSKENDVVGIDQHDPFPRDKFDLVIHLGANSSTTEKNIESIMRTNYDYSMTLLQRCQRTQTPLIYASSASVYGKTTTFSEGVSCRPDSPYAWTKYLFDRHVLGEYWDKAPVQGLRFFNVYGPGEEHKGAQASVFSKFPKEAKEQGTIKLFENSDKIYRDFIHVNDVVSVIDKFVSVKKSGIWNVGTGSAESFQAVGEAFSKKYNVPITEIAMPSNMESQYQYFTESNNTKLLRTIGNYKFTNPIEWIEQQ